MRIDNVSNPNIIKSYGASQKLTSRPAASSPSGNDKVTFSDEALSFSRVLAEMREDDAAGASERASRIAGIKASVAAGTYSVPADEVADAMLSAIPLK